MQSDGRVAGLVLAGGAGRRMGGVDKAALVLGGETLIARALARLAPQAAPLAVAGGTETGRLAGLGVPVLADPVEPGAGPLAGVLAGMRWARGKGAARLVTVAVDTPFFPLDMAARLADCTAPIAVAALRDRDGRVVRHPTCALWDVALEDALDAALAGGTRKVGAFLDAAGAEAVVFPCAGVDPFFNVNTAEDLALARSLVADG